MNQPPKIKLPQKPKTVKLTAAVDFYELFQKVEACFNNCFLLESLGQGPYSRYAILGFEPKTLISGKAGSLTVSGKTFRVDNPYQALRAMTPRNVISRGFAGGLVGYLSYEAAQLFEPTLALKQPKEFGLFCFGLYTDGLVHDKLTGETTYFYYTRSRLPQLIALLKQPPVQPKLEAKFLGYSLSRAKHRVLVNNIKREVAAGNVFQCEAGLRANWLLDGSPLAAYGELRQINPSPHMYYLKFGPKIVLGASPELLFDLKNGEMQTFPLAGSAARGQNEQADRRLAKQLSNSPKERAEHLMLVDLHRNDLGRVARFGTVRIRRLMDIKKFSHVQHLESEIAALIAPEHDMFSALASCFPAGTLSGAPKIEAMQIIGRSEPQPRGPYGGAVGFFGFNGDCTFAIPIRSLFVAGRQAYAQACGGIVWDSKPSAEYQELINKLRATELALQKFL